MHVTQVLGHKNQYQVSLDDGAMVKFQSYDTHICTILKESGCVSLIMEANTWSVTTGKHFVAVLKNNYTYTPVMRCIEHGIFNNIKDAMYRLLNLRADNQGIEVNYKDDNGKKQSTCITY